VRVVLCDSDSLGERLVLLDTETDSDRDSLSVSLTEKLLV
jgi:hypothetical protein